MKSSINRFWPKTALVLATLAAMCGTYAPAGIAQSTTTAQASEKPLRIGLALSGGGARGLAHIGVLKVLEELRVPVHCVTGTSIGSIVGGAYASGSPARQLEDSVIKTDWSQVFRDQPPRQETSSRRKLEDYKTLFAPEYGVQNGGLALPKGLIAGVSIEAYFRAITAQSVGIDNFSKLPIPFRAVASDIETGNAVVLDRGSVAQAMRASMAVPGAMAPVEIDGRLLVDGGIANNLPIDEARKLCADVIIAVNISTPPLKREEITSALSVSLQLINFLGKQTVEQQLKSLSDRDVLITPELGDLSAGNFGRAADAIRIGEEATRAMADALRRYSLPPEQYAALRRQQTADQKTLGVVDEIRFTGLERTNPEVLRSLVQSKPGEPLTHETVGADLRRIYGRGDFESVDFRIGEESGKRIMLIEPREKSWGPDYLRFGIGLASDFQGESPFNALVSYRKTWLNRLGGEWLSELQVGRDSRLFTEFYQPIDERGRFFVAPYGSIGESARSIYLGSSRVAEYNIQEGRIGLDAGAVLGTWGEMRFGPVWRDIRARVETGSPALPEIKEKSAGLRFRLYADQLDSAYFSRSGYRIDTALYTATESMGSDQNYQRASAGLTAAKTFGPHTFNAYVSGGTDLGSDMPFYDTFVLGGPLQLSGYHINEFSGNRMTLARLMYYNRTLPLPDLFGSGIYLGASLEAGRMSNPFNIASTNGTVFSSSVFLGADTFIGPAYLGMGFAEKGRFTLYMLIGVP